MSIESEDDMPATRQERREYLAAEAEYLKGETKSHLELWCQFNQLYEDWHARAYARLCRLELIRRSKEDA